MFFQYRVSSSLIDAFLSYWEEEMAFVLPVWACIKKWWNTELESCLSLIHAKWRIFLEVISLDCFETCWRRTMYIHACISFIRLYYKYLHFFYKSGYITYIYCLDIFLSQSAEYCQLLDIFLSLSLEYEIKREVSRRLSLQGEYVRLWYFLSHLLFVTNCLDLFCKDDKECVLSFDWLCCL